MLTGKVISLRRGAADSECRFSPSSRGEILVPGALRNLDEYSKSHEDRVGAKGVRRNSYCKPDTSRQLTKPFSTKAYIPTLKRIWGMTPLDVGLMVFGTYVSLVAVIEYMLWEALVWALSIPKPSNAALVVVGANLFAVMCQTWVS